MSAPVGYSEGTNMNANARMFKKALNETAARLEQAEGIVRALAASGEGKLIGDDWRCVLCGRQPADPPFKHSASCPYERSVEAVKAWDNSKIREDSGG